MPIVVPFTFATAGLNTPTSQLDSNFSTIASFVNARVPTVGALAGRPAAGNAGAIYVTTDEAVAYTFYVDDGAAWHATAFSTAQLHGQCRLTKSGASLLLSPFNGNKLIIAGTVQTIPDAGVSLALGAALASTTYYIYAFMSGATMTLEFSTTTHATQAATGVEIKSGDATRTLVGLARTTSAPAWADSATQRFTLSYFNRRSIGAVNNFTANRTTASTTYVELNTEIRVEFVTWADEAVAVGVNGLATNSVTSTNFTAVGFDGTNQENAITSFTSTSAGVTYPVALAFTKNGLAEGYHYATVLGAVGANTGTWVGGAYAADTTVRTILSLALGIRG